MSDIFIHLPSIQQKSNNEEYNGTHNSCPESLNREFVRKNISQNWKAYHQLDDIITKLGEVVYLLFVHHGGMTRATDVPEGDAWRNVLIHMAMLG